MLTRRGLLAGILASGFAPAAIGSGVLMPVRKIITAAPLLRTSGSTIHLRRATADAWCAVNPILAPGEFGLDDGRIKVGDGKTRWSDLTYL